MTPAEIATLWREALATSTPPITLVTLDGAVLIMWVRRPSGDVAWLVGPIRKGSSAVIVAFDTLADVFELFEGAGIEIPSA